MSMPLVSIVIPVYNGSNYMKEAIDSALAQTYKNIEIIVVNDGSTDNTDEIAQSYGNKIRYFQKENGGVASALNLAIQKAKGEYISWLSHDDLYLPNKISAQIKLLNTLNDEKVIIFSNFLLLYNNGTVEPSYLGKVHYTPDDRKNILSILFASMIHGCSLLIPKKAFEECGYFNTRLRTTQDYDRWFDFIKHGYKFYWVDKFLVKGRIHPAQDSQAKINLCRQEQKELFTHASQIFFKDILLMSRKQFRYVRKTLKHFKIKKYYRLFKILRLFLGKIF